MLWSTFEIEIYTAHFFRGSVQVISHNGDNCFGILSLMKARLYCIFLIITLIVSCTSKDKNVNVPFKLQPDGLKKKIEAELIENSKKEIVESMQEAHETFEDFPVIGCWDPRIELNIQRNHTQQIMVRSHIIDSMEEIQSSIFLYYTVNADLNQAQVEKNMRDPNYTFFNYPFFNRVSLEFIERKIKEMETELKFASDDHDTNLIQFYSKYLNEWKMKHLTIQVIEVEELVEIQPQAFIQIEDATNKKGLSPLTEEAIRGILNVRNYASRKYFGVSYYSLYFDASRKNDAKAQNKVDAIDHLYQMKIVDESYARSKGLQTKWNQYEEELPIEITEEEYVAPSQVEATPPPTESILQE